MFEKISTNMKNRMSYLEVKNQKDRKDGTPMGQRLKQITPEIGKFLALTASNCPEGKFLEIGTSGGYSALWISLVCMDRNIKLSTFEILAEKVKIAEETFKQAQVYDYIDLIQGDAVENLSKFNNISFVFLDAKKDIYEKCYDLLIPRMVKGGILIADNALTHYEELKPMINKTMNDKRVDSLIVPFDKGELICRKK